MKDRVSFTADGDYTINFALHTAELALLDYYEGLWDKKHQIEVEADPEDAKTALQAIEDAAQSALDVIDLIDGSIITINTSKAVSSVEALSDALSQLPTNVTT